MRQMTRATDKLIMDSRAQSQQARTNAAPQLLHLPDGSGIGLGTRSNDTDSSNEEVGAGRGHAGLFRSGHRMAADKKGSSASGEEFQITNNAAFYAAYVCNNRAGPNGWEQPLHQGTHLSNGSAKHD